MLKSALMAFILLPCTAVAQDQSEEVQEKKNVFSIDAELLTRGEIRSGGLANEGVDEDENIAKFILERTRLGLDYERDILKAHITAQHSAVWGQAGKGSLNIYEAWAQLKAHNGLFAKLGRQVLSYDDERIIGSNDWAVTALSHDVLKLGYEGHGHKVHAIFAYNQNSESVNGTTLYLNGDKPYKTMQTLWYHYDFQKIPLGASLLFMNMAIQGGNESDLKAQYNQQLLGGYAKYDDGQFGVEASYYRQMGKAEQGIKLKTWMASARGTFSPNEKWRLVGGYDVLSGDPQFPVPGQGQIGLVQHKEINGFTPAYGSHHKFYGAMDFFYVTTYHNGFTPGLQNMYAGVEFSPVKPLKLGTTYHYYSTETKLNNLGKKLGHEIEFTASYDVLKEVKVSLGYTFMAGSKTMEALKRVDHERNLHWAWLNVLIRPRFLSVRW